MCDAGPTGDVWIAVRGWRHTHFLSLTAAENESSDARRRLVQRGWLPGMPSRSWQASGFTSNQTHHRLCRRNSSSLPWRMLPFLISHSRSGESEVGSLLGCCALQCGIHWPTFRTCLVPHRPDGGGSKRLWNVFQTAVSTGVVTFGTEEYFQDQRKWTRGGNQASFSYVAVNLVVVVDQGPGCCNSVVVPALATLTSDTFGKRSVVAHIRVPHVGLVGTGLTKVVRRSDVWGSRPCWPGGGVSLGSRSAVGGGVVWPLYSAGCLYDICGAKSTLKSCLVLLGWSAPNFVMRCPCPVVAKRYFCKALFGEWLL